MIGRFVIWHNKNNDTYYYKFVKWSYYDYKPGLVNQYNHEVICVINLREYITLRNNFVDYKRMLISKIQRALEYLK